MPKLVNSSLFTVHRIKKSVNGQLTTVNRKSKGFTLIELLIVIVLIGILAAVGFYMTLGRVAQSRDAVRKSDLDKVKKALELARTECKNSEYYPVWVLVGQTAEQKYENTTDGLSVYLKHPNLGYLKKSPQDPKYNSGSPSTYYYGYAPDGTAGNYLGAIACTGVNGTPNNIGGSKDYRLVTRFEKTDDPAIAASQQACPWSSNFILSIPTDYAGQPIYVVCPD